MTTLSGMSEVLTAAGVDRHGANSAQRNLGAGPAHLVAAAAVARGEGRKACRQPGR
jgi:hypothetical protein